MRLMRTRSTRTVAAKLGLSQTGDVRRGKSIIATEESRTNTSYGLLATPDRVQSVVLPTDGLLRVTFSALWKEASLGAARAAIFVGGSQLKVDAAEGVASRKRRCSGSRQGRTSIAA